MVGKWIWNKTDGSVARIESVATNAITTTRLIGGTANIWANSDRWVIDPFVVTLAKVDSDDEMTQYEETLVISRATDALTCLLADRGYNGTTANTFDPDDYCYLLSTAPIEERRGDIVLAIAKQQDTDRTSLATAQTDITAQKTGSYHYVVTTGSANAYVAATPALASYAAGNMIVFKANFTNSGAATINVNGLGAAAIKKNDGATALAANDIISGQIVILRYDGTNFQMLSPIGTPATVTTTCKTVFVSSATSSAAGASTTSLVLFDTNNYTIPANDLVAGVAYEFEAGGDATWAAGNFTISACLAGASFTSTQVTPTGSGTWYAKGTLHGTATAGASVSVLSNMLLSQSSGTPSRLVVGNTAGSAATNGTLLFQMAVTYSSSNAGNHATLTTFVVKKVSATSFA